MQAKTSRYVGSLDDAKTKYSEYLNGKPDEPEEINIGFSGMPVDTVGTGEISFGDYEPRSKERIKFAYRLSGIVKYAALSYAPIRMIATKTNVGYLVPHMVAFLAYAVCVWNFWANVFREIGVV